MRLMREIIDGATRLSDDRGGQALLRNTRPRFGHKRDRHVNRTIVAQQTVDQLSTMKVLQTIPQAI